jgi:hypothetical protein
MQCKGESWIGDTFEVHLSLEYLILFGWHV